MLGVFRSLGGWSSFELGDIAFLARSGSSELGKGGEEGGRASCIAVLNENRFVLSESDGPSSFVDSGGSG